MEAIFFTDQNEFRVWLENNHLTEKEVMVGFYKVNSGKPNMSWSQSVDQALCFGWIDGVRKSIDKDRYQIRFTKRKPDSIWSAVNIKKMEALINNGLMRPEGLLAFAKRTDSKSKVYTYENIGVDLSPEFEAHFQAHHKAWEYFQALAPSYRKSSVRYVMSAKQEETRWKRLHALISDSEAGTNAWKDNKYKK